MCQPPNDLCANGPSQGACPAVGQGVQVFELASHTPAKVLALGSQLKAAPCLCSQSRAVITEPVGDLTDPEKYRRFVEVVTRLKTTCKFEPDILAHDLHPLYQSTKFAQQCGLPLLAVQHHHAHVVSVMAEWRIERPVIGVCCDGVGYGADGGAWGCEILRCDAGGYARMGTLDDFPLIGGDLAAIQTWRPAAALLHQAFGASWRAKYREWSLARGVPGSSPSDEDLDNVARMLERGTAMVRTSSLGRVFDAVSHLLGLCNENKNEADAARALELACGSEHPEPYPYETVIQIDCIRMSVAPMIRAMFKDLIVGAPTELIAARFHETIARMLAATAIMAAEKSKLFVVVLAGGCFANQRLCKRLTSRLEARHFAVRTPRQLPCGDAALALGQAVIAGEFCKRAAGWKESLARPPT